VCCNITWPFRSFFTEVYVLKFPFTLAKTFSLSDISNHLHQVTFINLRASHFSVLQISFFSPFGRFISLEAISFPLSYHSLVSSKQHFYFFFPRFSVWLWFSPFLVGMYVDFNVGNIGSHGLRFKVGVFMFFSFPENNGD